MVPTSKTPRTLTQMLRERTDEELVHLLVSRPDLAFPVTADYSQIASRATTRHSVTRALASLNAFDLWVAARACLHGSGAQIRDLVDETVDERDVRQSVQRLLGLALLWGDIETLRPVRALVSVVGDVPEAKAPSAQPPDLPEETRSPALVDKVAAGSAFEFVRRMDVLVEHCDHQPARLKRSGGLANREVRALAALLDVPTTLATAHLEIAQAAGLLGVAVRGFDEVLLPTEAFDGWQSQQLADQWAVLTQVWLDAHPTSGPPWLKSLCLQAFGDPTRGTVLTAGDLREWLAWQRPRRPAGADRQATTMLEQAAWMGVTGLGALACFAPGLDVKALDQLLPARVDHVLVQADLTAIAPGPLTPAAARNLGALADVESRGGATVYRFTVESLQRAHDLGWSTDEILGCVEGMSRTPLPQPLTYLIGDLARRERGDVGPGKGQQASAGRHRLPERAAAIVGEDALSAADHVGEDRARELVAGLRSTPDTISASTMAAPRTGEGMFESPLATLREAVETGEVVWLGYVDTRGVSGERLVKALSVDDGRLAAVDARHDEPVSVAVHRITAAHIIRART